MFVFSKIKKRKWPDEIAQIQMKTIKQKGQTNQKWAQSIHK